MKVFIANFGRENYEWPHCLAGSYIATMQDERLHASWAGGNREAYIDLALEKLKTAKGVTPTKGTASRWFNLGTIIIESSNDVWVHRDGDDIWWTVTTTEEGRIELGPDLRPAPWGSPNVYFYRKPSQPWSNRDKLGRPLKWSEVHPKAHDFLTTEATLQNLGSENSDYLLALIAGDDLQRWHDQPKWRSKTQTGRKRMPVTYGDARQRTIMQMVIRAEDVSRNSNGQIVERRVKNKEFRFPDRDVCARYLNEIYDAQEGLCALSDLPLQWVGGDEPELCCSLDRKDSSGHYERDNLQIVARFINRWKSDGDNDDFSRLLDLVKAV